ncbi:RidA family protein [Variovorax beijingensis]|uniref:RidA family protein n=1 Tax=Variovorax beijingensis TaxID=2496117 RepID=A0ABY0A5I3_9BURK|nr:RidA family protein [Variovorax beijingensis]RSZ35591.1 RidA family protein [Variovorax beijingensis]
MTAQARDQIADRIAAELGHSFEGELVAGGNYIPVVRDGRTLYTSGQVPRVGTTVVVTGRVGDQVPLGKAREAAQICTLRCLVLLRRELGSLDGIEKVLRVGVFVQCTADFTQQSEVADAASELLHRVFGEAGVHVRTAVGVHALPKNASVELEMTVAAKSDAGRSS